MLYNRSGSELRVESRTRELYSRQTDGDLYLCALSDGGELAVVTDDVRKLAMLTVYDTSRKEVLTWSLTTTEGIPMRMEFSPDGSQLAVATLTAQEGQVVSNLYLVNLRAGDPQLLASEAGSTPLDLEWQSNSRLLAVYDTHAALYGSDGSAQARREFGGAAVAGLSASSGGLAVLFGSGQASSVVLMNSSLDIQYEGTVPTAHGIARGSDAFYLLCDSSVECFGLDGTYQWTVAMDARPQAMLANSSGLFVFTDNMVQRITPPDQDASSEAADSAASSAPAA